MNMSVNFWGQLWINGFTRAVAHTYTPCMWMWMNNACHTYHTHSHTFMYTKSHLIHTTHIYTYHLHPSPPHTSTHAHRCTLPMWHTATCHQWWPPAPSLCCTPPCRRHFNRLRINPSTGCWHQQSQDLPALRFSAPRLIQKEPCPSHISSSREGSTFKIGDTNKGRL